MSRPIVVIACMIGSSESWRINSTHINGTHVPVEEPSTASEANIDCLEAESVSARRALLVGGEDRRKVQD